MSTPHVIRWCEGCEGRTGQRRSQWTSIEDGVPIITTEWVCLSCGIVHESQDAFTAVPPNRKPLDQQPTTPK